MRGISLFPRNFGDRLLNLEIHYAFYLAFESRNNFEVE
jgi:hypothetical protein